MGLKVIIGEEVVGFAGEYDIDLNFTHDEAHLMKKESGVRMGELPEAIQAVDADVILALGVIAARRAGKNLHPDLLKRTKFGTVHLKYEDDPEEEEVIPPAPRAKKPANDSSAND